MSNHELIAAAAVEKGLFTKEQAEAIMKDGQSLPLHTYAEWQQKGFQVRKGEKSVMQCKIFMPKNKEVEGSDGKTYVARHSYYMKTAYFFTSNQVDAIYS